MENYEIENVIEEKKEIAEAKELDLLLSYVYHTVLYSYPKWLEAKHSEYVCPLVIKVKNSQESERSRTLEIVTEKNIYKIVSEKWSEFKNEEEEKHLTLTLFLNNQKVFGITENIKKDDWGIHYKPSEINTFVNEAWVNDFKILKNYHKKIEKIISKKIKKRMTFKKK